jgi:integrase
MPRKVTGVKWRTWKRADGTTGGGWYARVAMPDGREVWRACPTREAAIALVSELRDEAGRLRLGLPTAPRGSRVTFREVIPDFLAWSRSNKRSWERDDRSLKHLSRYFGDRVLSEITPREVERYREARRSETTHYGSPPSNPTLNREVRCLTRLMRWAVDRGLLPESPLRGLRLPPEAPPRVPVIDSDTEARLLAALPAWSRLPVTLALRTGARAGEILAARWKDIDLDRGTWTIPDSKNLSPRTVPLHPEVVSMLRPHRGLPDALVCTRAGQPVPVHTLSERFHDAARKIGRPDLRLHDCRHAFGSRLLAAGAALPEIAALLGHKTLYIAARYSHASADRLRALVAALPPTPAPAPVAEVVPIKRPEK